MLNGKFPPPRSVPVRQENWLVDIQNNRRWLRIVVATVVLSLLVSVAALVLAVLAYQDAQAVQSSQVHLISRPLPSSPYAHYLAATDAPLTMTLENDLIGRVGKVFRIWSRSAQPHVVQIVVGGQNPTFDGSSKTATFGGAIGDGFTFEVIDRNKIALVSVTNVVFS